MSMSEVPFKIIQDGRVKCISCITADIFSAVLPSKTLSCTRHPNLSLKFSPFLILSQIIEVPHKKKKKKAKWTKVHRLQIG